MAYRCFVFTLAVSATVWVAINGQIKESGDKALEKTKNRVPWCSYDSVDESIICYERLKLYEASSFRLKNSVSKLHNGPSTPYSTPALKATVLGKKESDKNEKEHDNPVIRKIRSTKVKYGLKMHHVVHEKYEESQYKKMNLPKLRKIYRLE